jgi:hypothetical protein
MLAPKGVILDYESRLRTENLLEALNVGQSSRATLATIDAITDKPCIDKHMAQFMLSPVLPALYCDTLEFGNTLGLPTPPQIWVRHSP